MSSSFNLSSFQDVSQESTIGDIQDPTILDLQEKISQAEINLELVFAEMDEKKQQHENELTSLSQEIENAKGYAKKELERQQNQFQNEYERVKSEYENEKLLFEKNLQNVAEINQTFVARANEITLLSEEAKMNNLERKVEAEKAKHQEEMAEQQSIMLDSTLKRQYESHMARQKYQNLERTLTEVHAARRQQMHDSRLKISELTSRIQIKKREHETLVKRLRDNMESRNSDYANHIQAVKTQLEREKGSVSVEIESLNVRIQNLQKYLQSISKRGNQQLTRLQRDIDRLRRELDMSANEGFGFSNRMFPESRSSLAASRRAQTESSELLKMQHIQNEVQNERDKAAYLQNELGQTKAQISYCYNELRNSALREQRAYSSSLSHDRRFKNSIF